MHGEIILSFTFYELFIVVYVCKKNQQDAQLFSLMI